MLRSFLGVCRPFVRIDPCVTFPRLYRQLMMRARFDAQLLSRAEATTPEQVVERLLAVQGQDPRGFRLAVRARSSGLTTADVERSLNEGRLVVSWLNRGTLHLVRAEDYWQLFGLTTPQLWTANVRRLRQEGVDEPQTERGVAVLAEVVADGPRTRSELRIVLDEAGVPTAGQALVHLLWAASVRGLLVRGPMRNGEQAFVSAPQWLGSAPEFDETESLTWLARRYLAGHGPATAADLAKWANLPLGKARRGLAGLGDEAVPGPEGLVDLADRPEPAPLPAPRLLGAFDPVLLGWVDRSPVVGDHVDRVLVGGIFRAFALVEGRAVATWRLSGKRIQIDYLEEVSASSATALDADANALLDFLGGAQDRLSRPDDRRASARAPGSDRSLPGCR
jgi:hypothetical protein